jgi:hypothetical protein
MQYRIRLLAEDKKEYDAIVESHSLTSAKIMAKAFAAIEGHKLDAILAVYKKNSKWDLWERVEGINS